MIQYSLTYIPDFCSFLLPNFCISFYYLSFLLGKLLNYSLYCRGMKMLYITEHSYFSMRYNLTIESSPKQSLSLFADVSIQYTIAYHNIESPF